MEILNIKQLTVVTVREKQLLTDMTFSLNTHEMTCVIGPNGAGKSSLFKAILEFQRFHKASGEINFLGRSILTWNRKDLAQKLAYLPQFSQLDFPFRVQEIVTLGRIPHATGRQIDADIVCQAMELMDILHLKDCVYPQLSGGEKQRVQLARVLTQIWQEADYSGQLIILDEPSSALDIAHQHQLMSRLKSCVKKGLTVLIALHDFNLANQYADCVLMMDKGSLLKHGAVNDVINAKSIETLYKVSANEVLDPSSGIKMIQTYLRNL